MPTLAKPDASRQKQIVKPWIVVKSTRKKNEPAYPPVIMPRESHGYIKAPRFDFL